MIIGITGLSGTGKSTMADDLVKILYNEIKEARKIYKWIILDFFAPPKIKEIW